MVDLLDVSSAARELGVNSSRVRALIAAGALDAEKIGGRWLVDRASVAGRRRASLAAGRPLTPRNAWALLLMASGEQMPVELDPMTRWRTRQSLNTYGLVGLRARLSRRSSVARFWALPGELRALRGHDLVLTGSNAAGACDLDLLAPKAIDAYVPEGGLAELVREHALDPVGPARANVILREVPSDAWLLDDRRCAPIAAVALDLASYADSRSSRVGREALERLDQERAAR